MGGLTCSPRSRTRPSRSDRPGGKEKPQVRVRLDVGLLSKLEVNLGNPRVRESLPIYPVRQGLL